MHYQDYLNSEEWKILKLKYKAAGLPWECKICKTKKDINLHHRHYNSLGRENIKKDVVPLCGTHHAQVHWDNRLGKTPLEYKYLYKREQYLYRKYNGIVQKLLNFKLGDFINSFFLH